MNDDTSQYATDCGDLTGAEVYAESDGDGAYVVLYGENSMARFRIPDATMAAAFCGTADNVRRHIVEAEA